MGTKRRPFSETRRDPKTGFEYKFSGVMEELYGGLGDALLASELTSIDVSEKQKDGSWKRLMEPEVSMLCHQFGFRK